MRAASDMPSPPRARFDRGDISRFRVLGIVAIAALFILIFSMRGIANEYTDYLWFKSLSLTSVWRGILLAKVVLAAIFIGFFFALMWINLYLADRLAPAFRPPGPEEQVLARYHDVVGGRSGLVRLGITALFALSAGAGAATQWNNWILFRNGGDFGAVDAQFGRDIGFFVFQLPFLTFVVDWLFTTLLITLVVTAGAHYLNGGIRVQAPGDERVTPQVKGHLSVLLGLMAIVKAVDYWLARFELTVSGTGTVDGASYTDVSARLPVLNLLILIALFASLLFIVNIRLRGWVLPTVAVGLWAIVSIVMQGIYPFAIQRFVVAPSEADREAAYISRNIDATRQAYGLDDVVRRSFPYSEDLTADDIVANADVLGAVPLIDREIVHDAFRLEQAELEFYMFPGGEVDVDRYEIDGEVQQVVIGARSLNSGGLSSPSWESSHISFTHGNGVAIAPTDEVKNQKPVFVVGHVPVENDVPDDIVLDQPRIYHGENMSGYAIINAAGQEVDFLDDDNVRKGNRYDGTGGVGIGGFFRQLAFAFRFGSIDPLISNLVTNESRVLYIRDVEDRLQMIAPFLEYDSDPYPVVAQGRVFYVVDAYTTTTRYPYSERANRESTGGSAPLRDLNYVRNSIKAVVDSYDGTVNFYVVDESDPIAQAYRKAFPKLFTAMEDIPEEIAAHFRYPEDMFIIQTNMWARYQIGDPQQFYEEFGGWDVAQDPGGVKAQNSTNVLAADGVSVRSREQRVDPYYMQFRLPDETEPNFVIMRSYVEVSDNDQLKEMTAFIAGTGDWGEDYGRLLLYRMPSGRAVAGPALAASHMSSQKDISETISLLDVEGTEVEMDDLIIVPIQNTRVDDAAPTASLLYVRPFYVTPTTTKLPALEWVITAYADSAVMCPTYNETLEALFGTGLPGVVSPGNFRTRCVGDVFGDEALAPTPPTDTLTTPDTPDTPTPPDAEPTARPFEGDNAALLTEVASLLRAADEARLSGDLGRYQTLVDEAIRLIERQDSAAAELPA